MVKFTGKWILTVKHRLGAEGTEKLPFEWVAELTVKTQEEVQEALAKLPKSVGTIRVWEQPMRDEQWNPIPDETYFSLRIYASLEATPKNAHNTVGFKRLKKFVETAEYELDTSHAQFYTTIEEALADAETKAAPARPRR